jgi:hypothetical protein
VTRDRKDDIRLAQVDADQADLRTEDHEETSEEVEVAEIRADIEDTRDEMGGTLQELGDRLDPGHLMDQAKENVREATIGRVEETAKGMSEMVMETIKKNPIPAAIAGTGLALLWMNRSSGQSNGQRYQAYDVAYGSGYGYRQQGSEDLGSKAKNAASNVGDTVGRTVGDVGENVGQTVGQVGQNVGQTVGQVGTNLDRFMHASPLAMGAIAIGAGAVIGALVPETPQEREMLGDASRQLGTAVRDTVDQATSKAEEKVDEAERSMTSSGATT